ncbi:MAG: class II glutamine amidotransferase [Actinomycetota bacterium]
MCGIAGISAKPGDLNARTLSSALLRKIEVRGRDATGVAFVDTRAAHRRDRVSGALRINKAPVSARAFIGSDKFDVDPAARTVLLHTRLATQGSTKRNVNNHPIVAGDVVGVHNGVLDNDREIFAEIKVERRGEVDSEAAFALLNWWTEHPTDILEAVQGRAALAWVDRRTGTDLHLARLEGSPLAVAMTAAGSLIFASTAILLEQALKEAKVGVEFVIELPEWSYLRVDHGRIVDYSASLRAEGGKEVRRAKQA